MRVVRDAVGDVFKDGTPIHQNVRYLIDDQKRLAVFGTGKAAPTNVYGPDEVSVVVKRKPCSCKGDAPKMTLIRLWDSAEREAARVS